VHKYLQILPVATVPKIAHQWATSRRKTGRDRTVMQKKYVIVYQFGKVASTSIVATLDSLEGMTSVQSHFLGEAALSAIIPTITGADVSPYFFKHQLGQFVENVRITRQMNLIRAGKSGERLLVISLARNPLDWIRSSIVQDIQGYLPVLQSLLNNQGIVAANDSEIVSKGLAHIITTTVKILNREGGVDAYLDPAKKQGAAVFDGSSFAENPDCQRLFYMFLRPFDWFERHFEKALSVHPRQMKNVDGVLELSDQTTDYIIIRYEDLNQALPAYLKRNGMPTFTELKRENTSGAKPFAKECAAAFKTPEAQSLDKIFRESHYAATFGYSNPSH